MMDCKECAKVFSISAVLIKFWKIYVKSLFHDMYYYIQFNIKLPAQIAHVSITDIVQEYK